MIEEIMQLAIGNGLWAVLFVFLFLYQIKDSSRREKKYISTIDILSNHLSIIKKVDIQVSVVHGEVLTIKKMLCKKGNKSGSVCGK